MVTHWCSHNDIPTCFLCSVMDCGYFLASDHFNVKKYELKFSTKKKKVIN